MTVTPDVTWADISQRIIERETFRPSTWLLNGGVMSGWPSNEAMALLLELGNRAYVHLYGLEDRVSV